MCEGFNFAYMRVHLIAAPMCVTGVTIVHVVENVTHELASDRDA